MNASIFLLREAAVGFVLVAAVAGIGCQLLAFDAPAASPGFFVRLLRHLAVRLLGAELRLRKPGR